ARRDARHRRAHHGGHSQPDPARSRLQPGPHHCERHAAGGGQRPCRDRGLPRPPAREAAARMSEVPALKVEHLEVRYGDLVGVADVSLSVPEGQVVALLGSNGAGKTTTLNAIAGLVRSSGGSIKFRGEEIASLPAFAIVPKGLALSPEGWRLFVNQTVEQ